MSNHNCPTTSFSFGPMPSRALGKQERQAQTAQTSVSPRRNTFAKATVCHACRGPAESSLADLSWHKKQRTTLLARKSATPTSSVSGKKHRTNPHKDEQAVAEVENRLDEGIPVNDMK